ncbi:MAG: DUF4339 domain-containing protein [Kofleriaceae bacterium]|nr:DUF4339 domain-containing protein [Kofleriaceae bacterium]
MKFLCDRCKTRYSIGDDRVRGKILKIRCKNCANVITVREGMDAGDAAEDAAAPRRNRPTTAAHPISSAPAGALGAAFADQLAKPPPALEEEWYVSIDGVQSGPFSLAEAQRWVAAKPFEAELHCWSEGFDDWLPVDKVSHFRGLRKKPEPRRAPTAPPPIPRREDEPKPLFAATMAQLEKSVSAPSAPAIPPLGSLNPSPAIAKTNGHSSPAISPSLPSPNGRGSGPSPALTPSTQTPSPGAAALRAAFDRPAEEESRTTVDAPPFKDESAAKPSPVKPIHDDSDDDDGLDIGEVSRVVKLADIATMGRRSSPTVNPATATSTRSTGSMPRINTGATGSVPRMGMTGSMQRVGGLTGNVPRMTPSELGMNVNPALAGMSPGSVQPDESMVAQSFATKHRRGLLLLISVSAVLVLGVVAAVIFVVNGSNNEDVPGSLGGTRQIDTSRPEDIVKRALPPSPGEGSGSAIAKTETKPKNTGPRITQPNTPHETPDIDDGKGSSLRASEIEDMAAKQGEGTKRCYMRAQKGAIGFEIADLKKIEVTLTVGKDGVVNSVNLSSHAGDSFGQCLIARIKSWKFRESSGGTFRISLAFSAS